MNETNETPAPEDDVPAAEAAPVSDGEASTPAATDAPALEAGLEIGSQAVERQVRLPQTLRGRVLKDGTAVGTGRRKTAVARVRLRKGDGKFTVNNREFEEFFCIERDRLIIQAPLRITSMLGLVDVWVRTDGGGTTGQAGAIVLGIARALQAMNPELHELLSGGGFLTRDGRMVERKKYGHKKARRSFQFSKR